MIAMLLLWRFSPSCFWFQLFVFEFCSWALLVLVSSSFLYKYKILMIQKKKKSIIFSMSFTFSPVNAAQALIS
jgi:hypothetical protein